MDQSSWVGLRQLLAASSQEASGNVVRSVYWWEWGECSSQRWHGIPDFVTEMSPLYSSPAAVVMQSEVKRVWQKHDCHMFMKGRNDAVIKE